MEWEDEGRAQRRNRKRKTKGIGKRRTEEFEMKGKKMKTIKNSWQKMILKKRDKR